MRDTETLLVAILGIVGLEFLNGVIGIIVGSVTGIYLIFRIFHSIAKRKEDHEKRKEDREKRKEDHEKRKEDHEKRKEDHEKRKEDHEKWKLEMELLREELASKKKENL